MKNLDKLVSDIMVHLDRQEATGWYSVHCPMCNERRTKTGGFFFTDTGVIYKCFRGKCDATCQLVVGEHVSKKFKALMKTIGVKIPVDILVAYKKSSLQASLEDDSHLYKKHSYKTIKLPEHCVPFDESKHPYKNRVADYLESRQCSLNDVFVIDDGRYKGFGAIGMYHGERLIGMHIITDTGKYISHYDGNTHVVYCPERYTTNPVILVEGGLDAKCFPNTVAIMSNKISPEQAYFLKGRKVIMLPDRLGGNKFIDQFHQYGWDICIPDWEEKDLNAAVLKYGKLVVAKKIVDGVAKSLLEAKARYKMWSLDGKGD